VCQRRWSELTDELKQHEPHSGTGKDDAEQHWFTCEAIWTVNKITDDVVKIAQLETTFRDRALQWYIK
jgi:hypothetical protein